MFTTLKMDSTNGRPQATRSKLASDNNVLSLFEKNPVKFHYVTFKEGTSRVSIGHIADLARYYLSDCFLRVGF